MKKNSITNLVLFIVSAELTGVLSALLSGNMGNFFEKYKAPPLLPPAWLFPAVWTLLYAAMGLSAYRVCVSSHDSCEDASVLDIYRIQLIVNFSWSIVFFRFEKLWLSVFIILTLLILIIIMILRFRKTDKTAAYLNIPYLLWVIFASYLNISTAFIN